MPYSFPHISPPSPVYIDPSNFLTTMMAAKKERQDANENKLRSLLLNAQVQGLPVENALKKQQMATSMIENKSKMLDMAIKSMPDDPQGIREWAKYNTESGVFQRMPSMGGVPVSELPDEKMGGFRDSWLRKSLSIKEQMEMGQPGYGLTGEAANLATMTGKRPTPEQVTGYETAKQKPEAGSNLSKLISERDALKIGDPRRGFYDQAIAKEVTRSGMVIESDGKGGFTVRTNVGEGATGMTKGTQTDIQKELLNVKDRSVRLKDILGQFKGEYQTLAGKFKNKWLAGKEFAGFALNDDEKSYLSEYATYSQDAIENLNMYINEITGAAMSEIEAKRIRKAMPDPGDSVLSGDSATQFYSKTINAYKKTMAADARYTYYLKQGLTNNKIQEMVKSDSAMSLDRTMQLMDQRYEDLLKKGMDKTTAMKQVEQEFGL